MIGSERNKQDGRETGGATEPSEELPFSVELWRATDQVERVLGRASTAALARAIFVAALNENPDKRVTLRRGADILDDSSR